MKKENNIKNISVWTMIRKIFPQVISVSPLLYISNTLLFIIDGASFAVTVIFMQKLFDNVTDLVTKKGSLRATVFALAMLFVVKISQQIIEGIDNFIGETYDPRTFAKLANNVNLKMSRLDPLYFENTGVLDDINKCYTGIRYAINFVNTLTDVFALYVPYFLFMGIYLYKLKPILAVSLGLVFLPVLITQLIKVKVYSKLEDRSAPIRRRTGYYEECLVSREYIRETRALGACPYFYKLYKDTIKQLIKLEWNANLKSNLVEFGSKIISLLGYKGILFLLFDSLMKQDISVGAFAAVFASIDSLFNNMEDVICGRIGYYSKNFGKVQNYIKFLDLPERDLVNKIESEKLTGNIALENVSFSYPNMSDKAIDNVSFEIKKGETLALVGENGSGKSTLVKLIIGLYKASDGIITHNNYDISEINKDFLYKNISGVFQNYKKYKFNLIDNVTISDYSIGTNNENVDKVLSQADIKINKCTFPDGYKTMLSTEFGGIDLSGGQWQKLAIARGLYRCHELIILDEPTAAIDPIEECKTYERFADISKEKTSIIITHRLGSVKFADRIVVLDKGKVIGIGNHEDLIINCSKYKNMWESQSKYYM
ncbi:ABC transporter ATP-binding protein [Clostridiaceae bacterium M8S5]|nr:ABC transporter ATP-binding protein [Clostridiaceae bacterium M8S5]